MNMIKPANKRRKKKSELGLVPKSADWPLSTRPGFLVRRLHQIHISMFMEACAEFRITPLQYSVLSILAASGPTDQTKLAAAVALDRTTTTGIVKRLHARGLMRRMTSEKDRRAQLCSLTAAGKTLLMCMESSARKAHQDTLVPLSRHERTTLLGLLVRLVSTHADRAQQSDAIFLGKL
jgi:MarR family transcriptional regulator, lower aerobic nicotinate degradation pathway regulator